MQSNNKKQLSCHKLALAYPDLSGEDWSKSL